MKFIFTFLLVALTVDVVCAQWNGQSSSTDLTSTIYRNGTVAIGFSSTPLSDAKLDVRGGAINAVNTTTSSPYIFLGRNADPGNNDAYFYHRITTNYHILGSNKNGTGTLRKLGFAMGGGDGESDVKMTIDGSGNVGIGTSSPSAKLEVSGGQLRQSGSIANDNSALFVNSSATGYGLYSQGGLTSHYVFHFVNQAGTSVLYGQSDKVGIGTTSPQATLDVTGNLRTTSNIDASQYITVQNGGSYRIAMNGQSDGYITARNASGQDKFTITANGNSFLNGGNVGIGTTAPASQVHLSSDSDHALTLSRANGTYGFRIMRNAAQGNIYFQIATAAGTSWETKIKIGEGEGANTRLLLNPDGGNVGIGTTDPGSFKLAVNGKIWSQEVNVAMTNPGPDYVFEKDYNLLPLAEVENYIKQNKHLPEIPSAKEMEKDGLNLKEMNLLLLKKVEELTLHMIEANKKIDRLESDNTTLRQVNEQILTTLNDLKNVSKK